MLHMSAPLVFRPRFKFSTDLSQEEVLKRVIEYADSDESERVHIKMVHNHLTLDIPTENKHYYSPQLDLNLEKKEEGGTLVRCLIAPAPNIWTLFIFGYGILGFAAVIGLMLGLSQWQLDRTMWGFWIVGTSLGLGGLLHLGILEGQRLARDEMRLLKHFLDEALDCDCFQVSEDQKAAEQETS